MIPKELLPLLPFSSSISVVIQHCSRQLDIWFMVWALFVLPKAEKPKEELFEKYVDKKKGD